MKAVLVIDMPDNLDVPLEDIKTEITVWSKDVEKSMLYLKYKNVELKPLPKQFTTDEILMAKDVKTAIEMRAYNDCLEEIIGEAE